MFTGLDVFYHKYERCGLPHNSYQPGYDLFKPLLTHTAGTLSGKRPSAQTVLHFIVSIFRGLMHSNPPEERRIYSAGTAGEIGFKPTFVVPAFAVNTMDGRACEIITRFCEFSSESAWNFVPKPAPPQQPQQPQQQQQKQADAKSAAPDIKSAATATTRGSLAAASSGGSGGSDSTLSALAAETLKLRAKWRAADSKQKCPFLYGTIDLINAHSTLPSAHPPITERDLHAFDGFTPYAEHEPISRTASHLKFRTAKEFESYLSATVDRTSVPGVNLWIVNPPPTVWSADRHVHSLYPIEFRRAVRCLLLIWSRRGGPIKIPPLPMLSSAKPTPLVPSASAAGAKSMVYTKSESAGKSSAPAVTGTGTGIATPSSPLSIPTTPTPFLVLSRHPFSRLPKDVVFRIISYFADALW